MQFGLTNNPEWFLWQDYSIYYARLRAFMVIPETSRIVQIVITKITMIIHFNEFKSYKFTSKHLASAPFSLSLNKMAYKKKLYSRVLH